MVVGEAGLPGPQHGPNEVDDKQDGRQPIAAHDDHVPPNAQEEQIIGVKLEQLGRPRRAHPGKPRQAQRRYHREPEAAALDDTATNERPTQGHLRHGLRLPGQVGELRHKPGKNLRHAVHLHEGMNDDPLIGQGVFLAAAIFADAGVNLAEGQLAVAEQTPDKALLHHHGLHAVDVDALEGVLQQAVFHLDAVVAAARLEAAVPNAGTHRREHPQHEHQHDDPRRNGPDQVGRSLGVGKN